MIPHAVINSIEQVCHLAALKGKLMMTTAPDGRTIHMQPLATEMNGELTELSFTPKCGDHIRSTLSDAGYSAAILEELSAAGIISCGRRAVHQITSGLGSASQ